MNVHNLMEEYVEKNVNGLYDQLMGEKTPWLKCDCGNCRLDAISYVLNRVAPHYIVSGRGAVYAAQLLEDTQLKADVTALSMEAIRCISSVQRPYHRSTGMTNGGKTDEKRPMYNFPVISGAVYDGTTFEPIFDAEITLLDREGVALMHDVSWANPSKTFKSTKGSFSFWPEAVPAEKAGETRKFCFTVQVKAKDYATVREGFEIVLMSDGFKQENINQSLTMRVQDQILFKE